MYIPEKIREELGDRSYEVNTVGMSEAQIICFVDMVLKIGEQNHETEREYDMMKWLSGRVPVPKIIMREQENGMSYLLMSRVDGEMACEEAWLESPEKLVRLLAEGLRMLWRVDTTEMPYDNCLKYKLQQAKERVDKNLCSMEDMEEGTYGEGGFESPSHLWQWLVEHQPSEELVLSHGDYCLPNIFIKDNEVSGFIDLGRSGIADKYQDIALCYRSLKHNLDGTYGGKAYKGFNPDGLFEALGIQPDWEKIRYYILLDELF